MQAKKYVDRLTALFENNRKPGEALPMKRYMKNRFEFYGIKSPLRRELLRQFLKENGKPDSDDLQQTTQLLWDNEHREMQYAAMDILEKSFKLMDETYVAFLEKLLLKKSWWDTVDWLAARGFGKLFQKYPQYMIPVTGRWIQSENIWLQRTAIIFQLNYREKTNAPLLFDYILSRANNKEFFVQKGSGWALRQYSKYNPMAVTDFIQKHENSLSNLTKREGLKWLERQRLK